jgi:hypothetical protein
MAARRPSIALLVLGALLLLGQPGPAAGQAVQQRQFIERDVPVQAEADDAVQARSQALRDGQVAALQRLMARLSGRDPASLPEVAPGQIDRYVRSFEIQQEQVGARSYAARLTVDFRQEPVQELLDRNGLSYALVPTLPTVVLAYSPGGDPYLDGDPWRSAVLDAAGQSVAVEPILPLGDAQDLAIGEAQALAGDAGTLRPVAERYGTDAVLVAHAAPATDGSQGLVVSGQYLDRDGLVQAVPALSVPPGLDGQADYPAAATALLVVLDRQIGQASVRSDATVELLSASVPLADLSSWVQIRRALADTPEIRSTRIERMTRREARIVLGHVGSVEGLQAALQRRGLALSQEIEGWRLGRVGDRPMSTIGG